MIIKRGFGVKKTIFFVSSLGDGGAQRVISILSEKLAKTGVNVEIVTYLDAPMAYEVSSEVKVTCAQKSTGKKSILTNLIWLRSYFKKNASIVLSFMAPFNMIALVALMGTRVPIVVADRNDPSKVPGNRLIRFGRDFLYRFADHIVVQTEDNKSYFWYLEKKTTVIYNPVDLKEYTGSALQCVKEKTIVTAARLEKQKNQLLLLDAYASVGKKFPEYKLVIYGNGSYRQELEDYIKKLGLEDKVFLPGSVTDLYDRIKSASLFVLSSNYEGMPNALIEAMCLGLPVISTKVSGATDLIKHKKNGLLVNVGSEKELAEAMELVLSNEQFREEIAMEAKKISEMLVPDEIVKQWQEIIGRYSHAEKNGI